MTTSDHGSTRRHVLAGSAAALAALALGKPGLAASNDTLTFVEGSDFETLDPGIQRTRSTEIVLLLMFNRLVKWKDVELSGIAPDLAESWSVDDAGLAWTFHLRRGVQFHDGTKFDAEAVKFNFERLKDPKYGSPNRSLYAPISAIDVLDEHTVVLRTEKPYASILEQLAESSAEINSPAAVRRLGRDYGRSPVGTGPYKLAEWLPGERTVVERFDGYFGEKGRYRQIIYRPVPEGGARVVELQAGTTDIATQIPPASAAAVRDNPKLRLAVLPSTFQVFFELNNARPPFNDARLRRAINHAIDREAIVKDILGGFGGVPDSCLTPGSQAYVPIDRYSYDPDLARKAFKEAFPDGFNETLVMWTPNGRYLQDRAVAEATQGYLNAIGLKTEFRVWEWASYQQTLYRPITGQGTGYGSNAAHMWMLGTSIPTDDWRFTRRYGTKQSSNLAAYSNTEVDRLLDSARVTLDQERRVAMYHDVARILWRDDPPSIWLYNQKQIVGMQKSIGNFNAFGFEVPILADVTKG